MVKNMATISKFMRFILTGLVMLIAGCNAVGNQNNQIHQPVAAGRFYPNDQKALEDIMKKAFRQAPAIKLDGELLGLVLPHAAYAYSGVISALGMRTLVSKDIDTIYVIGTSHYADVGGAIIWQGKAFHTPYGNYPVDLQAVRELIQKTPHFHMLPRVWEKEHSVEVQVPFLQKVAPKAKLVPMVMGTSTWEECEAIAKAIAEQAATRKAIIIASVDLSHFPSYQDAKIIDQKILEPVEKMDLGLLDRIDREIMAKGIPKLSCTVCGMSALKTAMIAVMAQGANQGQKLYYANSGDVTKELGSVVGYAAVAFVKNLSKPALVFHTPLAESLLNLTDADKQELLNIARSSIAEGMATNTQMQPTTASKLLMERAAVFVTLKRKGVLQGCIGMTEPRLPLYQAVAQMACAAAFEDQRFKPLTAKDLPHMNIEISVLSPLRRILDSSEIIMGVHGVAMKRGPFSGLYLPQVAVETGWSKEQFLDNLCLQKAHVPASTWNDKRTELYVFQVLSFQQPAPADLEVK